MGSWAYNLPFLKDGEDETQKKFALGSLKLCRKHTYLGTQALSWIWVHGFHSLLFFSYRQAWRELGSLGCTSHGEAMGHLAANPQSTHHPLQCCQVLQE